MAIQIPLVSRLITRLREGKFTRVFQRHRCAFDATLLCAPRMAQLNGRMLDISRGGSMFRPALSYLMDRRGADASLRIGDRSIACRIVNTLPVGYALQFIKPLEEEELQELLSIMAQTAKQAA
jgi:hypothetical protein